MKNKTVPYKVGDIYQPGLREAMHLKGFHMEAIEAVINAVNSHDELVKALRVLVAHAGEMYPHFESERGQKDIQAALRVIGKAKGK